MIEDLRARYAGTGFRVEEERFWKPPKGERAS